MTSNELQKDSDSTTIALAIYVLYLVSIVAGITSIIGVIMAYVFKGEAPTWLQEHYRYQIRTFWIGLLYSLISLIMTMAVIGYLMFLAVFVWYIVRCVKGLKHLNEKRGIENAGTWLF